MKRTATLLLSLSVATLAFSQLSIKNRVTTFEYDLNGNVTGRKSVANVPGQVVGGGTQEPSQGKIDATWDGNVFTVHVRGDEAMPVKINLYDASPLLLRSEEFSAKTHTVDMSGYPNGIYVFGIKADDQSRSMKVIKAE